MAALQAMVKVQLAMLLVEEVGEKHVMGSLEAQEKKHLTEKEAIA